MPPTTITDPVVTTLGLLKDNWTAANTQSITPDISAGWYERTKDIAIAKVTVSPGDELEALVGLTADGPAALWDGTVDVNCWASAKVLNSAGTSEIGGALARKLAYEMRQEVDRIIRVNQTLVSGLLILRPIARRPLTDDAARPVVFRWLIECGYNWIEQPA